MKISKREKTLICMLGLIIGAFLYYQFGYVTLNNLVNDKTKQKEDIENKYQSAVNTISSMEAQKVKVKILNAKITDEATPFYPVISQDYIILEMDKLIKESGLDGGMTFKDIEVKSVSPEKKSDKDKDLPESSIQSIADEYRSKYESKEEKKDEQSSSENTDNSGEEKDNKGNDFSSSANNNSPSSSSTDSNTEKGQKENTIYQLQLNVDFNGTYAQVVKFLELLRQYDKKMPAYAINMSTKNLTDVKGSVNMMVYGAPKINNELEEYLTWNLNNTYGKDKPFTVNSATGTGIKSDIVSGDFLVSAKSANSDLPTIMIGKANDPLRNTYVYADSNIETLVELELTKEGDKYYYKYRTSNGSTPKNYNGNGNEFVPNGENIEINIQSDSRVNTEDKAGLKLKIINNTDKLVNVNISGDDKSDPRVSIDGDSQNINVNKE